MSETRPDKCSLCKKAATVHLTQIIDDKVKKVSMCGECPHNSQLSAGLNVDMVGELSSKIILPKPSLAGTNLECPGCGFTQADFKERGRLGCSRCYEVFDTKLVPILGKIHNGVDHKGKVPGVVPEPVVVVSPKEISALKNRLQELVDREEYEEAAEVRDRITELENLL